MKLFACQNCGQTVFFESVQCIKCGRTLGFLPDRGVVAAIEPVPSADPPTNSPAPSLGSTGSGSGAPPLPSPVGPAPPVAPLWRAVDNLGKSYRQCKNQVDHGICNWAIENEDDSPYCRACRLNHMIPNLNNLDVKNAWARMEVAKRRLLYTLFELDLPIEGKAERPDGLQFDFLEDPRVPDQPRVLTGHVDGVITINVAEADDPFREKMRVELGETYRTVLGHFRHEIGHYYWDRLIKSDTGTLLNEFRELFGDERADYAAAQKRHYAEGVPADWVSRFVSAYASMHPWEDWAETWAHYLHIADTLETARAHGVSLRPVPAGAGTAEPPIAARRLNPHSFDDLLKGWIPLTMALNNLNRSMGMNDCYPFVLSDTAVRKLRFVHEVVEQKSAGATRASAA